MHWDFTVKTPTEADSKRLQLIAFKAGYTWQTNSNEVNYTFTSGLAFNESERWIAWCEDADFRSADMLTEDVLSIEHASQILLGHAVMPRKPASKPKRQKSKQQGRIVTEPPVREIRFDD